jgi:hypothetical protein
MNAIPGLAGKAFSRAVQDSRPPADAPIPTTGKGSPLIAFREFAPDLSRDFTAGAGRRVVPFFREAMEIVAAKLFLAPSIVAP